MRRRTAVLLVAALGAAGLAGCSGGGDGGDEASKAKATTTTSVDQVVRLNEMQVVGTHNSYHRRLPDELFGILSSFDARLAASVDYGHEPLDEQLERGVRQLELDVFADPEGGRFASRAANSLIGRPKPSGIGELSSPGFKVLHLPEIDFESTCPTLVVCLQVVERWSAAHPRHVPIMVFVEAKDAPVPDVAGLGFATPVPIGAVALDALDAEIRSVFDADELLTPDDVRGEAATLREAVTTVGWPTLARARGKVLFCLLNDDAKRAAYVEGHESLRGRAMFTLSGVTAPESAVVSRPDPVAAADEIASLVRQGFAVRTRADADTVEARSGSVVRRDAALASAATWVSTDYPVADSRLGSGYSVGLPGGVVARCNPVLAPGACRPVDDLE